MTRKLLQTSKNSSFNINVKKSTKRLFKEGVVAGIGWAFGATIGFAVVSTVLVVILKSAGGLPLIGSVIASIVQVTLDNLVQNTPVFK